MLIIDILGKLHDFISKPILFSVFGLICIIYGVSSFILLFHWSRYAVDKASIVSMQSVYFIGGAFILLMAFLSVLLY